MERNGEKQAGRATLTQCSRAGPALSGRRTPWVQSSGRHSQEAVLSALPWPTVAASSSQSWAPTPLQRLSTQEPNSNGELSFTSSPSTWCKCPQCGLVPEYLPAHFLPCSPTTRCCKWLPYPVCQALCFGLEHSPQSPAWPPLIPCHLGSNIIPSKAAPETSLSKTALCWPQPALLCCPYTLCWHF